MDMQTKRKLRCLECELPFNDKNSLIVHIIGEHEENMFDDEVYDNDEDYDGEDYDD